MKKRPLALWFGLFFLAFTGFHCSAGQIRKPSDQSNPWGAVQKPSTGTRGPVGFYSAGCIDGAKALPSDGRGYQVMRLSRNRYYGDAELMDFIEGLTEKTVDQKIGVLLIGDLGQPRGGPMPTGHASHQVGLDVDIWYWIHPDAQYRPLTPEERETISAISYVDLDRVAVLKDLWRPEHVKMLQLAAEMPNVQRIFVNAILKRELCETIPAGRRQWLHVLRPWFGHHDHFHVRLKCPEGSRNCRAQDPAPPGDGCDDLAWWFTPEARAQDRAVVTGPSTPNSMPALPELCNTVLKM